MRLASFLLGLSFSAGLCSLAHAQTTTAAAPGNAYEEQAIGVRSLAGAGRETPPSGDRPDWMYAAGKWDAFRGLDHHPISEEAFYRIVGRDDLLRRYHREALVKKSLMVGGGTLVFGGLVFAAIATAARWGGAQPAVGCEGTNCLSANSRGPSPAWGLAAVGTGLVSLIVGRYLNPTPIDADQADSLGRSYDQSLQSRLGISETAARE